MSIAEVLAAIASMDDGSARGDAEALRVAIESVRDVGARLRSTFGVDSLVGQAADAADAQAHRLADEIDDGVQMAERGASAVNSAVGILAATHGYEGRLRAFQGHLRDNPGDAPEVRAAVAATMSGTYSSPMLTVTSSVPLVTPPVYDTITVGDDGGAMTNPAGTGSSPGRGPSGAYADFDAGTAGSSTPVPASMTSAPAALAPPPTTPTSAGPTVMPVGGGAPGSGRGGDGPGGLLRGGHGSPAADMRTAGAGEAPSADGSPSSVTSDGSAHGVGGPGEMGIPGFVAANPPAAALGTPTTSGPAGSPGTTPARTVPPTPAAPGGDRGNRADKHRPAAYLHHGEHGRDIVGDLPLVGPPVIGDWAPSSNDPSGSDLNSTDPAVGRGVEPEPSVAEPMSGTADVRSATSVGDTSEPVPDEESRGEPGSRA